MVAQSYVSKVNRSGLSTQSGGACAQRDVAGGSPSYSLYASHDPYGHHELAFSVFLKLSHPIKVFPPSADLALCY